MNNYQRAQKAEIMEMAEGLFEEWLGWQEEHERPTLSENLWC